MNKVDLILKTFKFCLPIFACMTLVFFYFGINSLEENKQIFIVNTTYGEESVLEVSPDDAPIVNISTTTKKLSGYLNDINTFNSVNYTSDERLGRMKGIFSEDSIASFWVSNIQEIDQEVATGVVVSESVVSMGPVMISVGKSLDGGNLYKFYSEVQLTKKFNNRERPLHVKRKVVSYIREEPPSDNKNGISIYRMDVK
jgi:hypothetical protein